jgi:hypothetical protein
MRGLAGDLLGRQTTPAGRESLNFTQYSKASLPGWAFFVSRESGGCCRPRAGLPHAHRVTPDDALRDACDRRVIGVTSNLTFCDIRMTPPRDASSRQSPHDLPADPPEPPLGRHVATPPKPRARRTRPPATRRSDSHQAAAAAGHAQRVGHTARRPVDPNPSGVSAATAGKPPQPRLEPNRVKS